MKKLFILGLAVLFVSASSFGQKPEEPQIPASVTNAFKSKFPNVKEVKWEKEDTIYTAEFLMNESPTEAEFNEKGAWLSTEWEISVDYTPQVIKDYISKNYSGYKLKELSVIELPVDGKLYVVEIGKKKDCHAIYFSLKGEFKKAVKEICNPGKKCEKKKPCKKSADEKK